MRVLVISAVMLAVIVGGIALIPVLLGDKECPEGQTLTLVRQPGGDHETCVGRLTRTPNGQMRSLRAATNWAPENPSARSR